MSTSTIKPLQTLKGIFSPPKMNHRRDFLRENKLNLRELQKVTSKKPTTTQTNQQGTYQFHAQQQPLNANRRSASQTRLPPMKQPTRSTSEHRIAKDPYQSVPSVNQGASQTRQNGTRCPSCNGRGDILGAASSSSMGMALKKTESKDKEIQTDDINDEEFLYCALKRCTSTEQNCNVDIKQNCTDNCEKQFTNDASARSRQSKSDSLLALPSHRSNKSNQEHYKNDYYNQGNQNLEIDNQNQLEENGVNDDIDAPVPPITTRSHDRLANEQTQNVNEDDKLNFGNLAIDNQQQHGNGPQSGRSRRTAYSMHSQEGTTRKKKSTAGSVHKFGSREDIRLPRYLEREKRDKEEQRLRENVRDPNCPPGHFVLSDDERLRALAMAEKKFKSLINELNRMPMTTETLRIRTRKADIEKELVVLESDIRIFSKPKVYVKQEDSEA